MRLLIPAHSVELMGEVQHCLLIAEQQGFDIKNIELGISPTQYFSLVESDQSMNITTSQYADDDAIGELDFILNYHSNLSIKQVAEQLSHHSKHVWINVPTSAGQYDIWQHLGSNRALLTYTSNDNDVLQLDSSRHLAWLLSFIALDFPIEDALVLARASCNVSRETWPNDFKYFPKPVLEDSRLSIQVGWILDGRQLSFPKMESMSLGLYPVVDSVEWIETLLKIGIKTTQLRIKDSEYSNLEDDIVRAIKLGEQYQAQVFINDYWQLAVKHGAFGVHLGQEDIEESNLSALNAAKVKLGLSTHGYYELLRIVQIEPSYIALGHIFPTTTKDMPSRPQGLVRLALYQQLIDSIPYTETQLGYPTVAIGGIDLTTAPSVWECGVSSLAVVRAVTLASSPKDAIESFNLIMSNKRTVGQIRLDSKVQINA